MPLLAGRIPVYQDVLKSVVVSDEEEDLESLASEAFFTLANAPVVGYRTVSKQVVNIRQNNTIDNSTGGIVWETGYFLARHLEHLEVSLPKEVAHRRVMEVGAGCGLLGLAISRLRSNGGGVVLTECTECIDHLRENVQDNARHVAGGEVPPEASLLRWDRRAEDVAAAGATLGEPFDLIVGTDVVFSVALVRPLLETIWGLSHRKTSVYICLQVRCQHAFDELLRLAAEYFKVEDQSAQLAASPGCELAESLSCFLFAFTERKKRSGAAKGAADGADGADGAGAETGGAGGGGQKKMGRGKRARADEGEGTDGGSSADAKPKEQKQEKKEKEKQKKKKKKKQAAKESDD
jgi:predicted nicotinamide N-methyase